MDADGFDSLASELYARFLEGVSTEWTEADFGALALRAFAHQFEGCAPYRALCERRGVTPATVARWEEVPAVPATAFKYFDFVSSPPVRGGTVPEAASGPSRPDAERVFLTSGTTGGQALRGRHRVTRPELYRASLLDPFRRALLPDVEAIHFVSLIPNPVVTEDSSLSFMVGAAADEFATSVDWLVDADGGWDADEVGSVIEEARAAAEPVLLLGTALAFVNVMEAEGVRLGPLPKGSRIMETGGFKGARRAVSRDALYEKISGATGVPLESIVNEYGMTELLSQLYEPVLTEGPTAMGEYVAPPWLRVRALDPTTLVARPEGEEGILSFFDLANLASVSHLLTEDVGSIHGGRVRLRGRAPGSEPRGCSRAMDDLMAASGRFDRPGPRPFP